MAYERDSQEDLVWDSENGEYVPAGGEEFTLTISPTPSDATVTLIAAGYTQSGNSITVIDGTTVSYSVAKTGYTTVYGAVTVTATNTIPVTLTISRPIVEESSIGTIVYDIHGKAIKNKNTVSSDEYIYNWVGTLAQYTAQDIEHTHPDWVCLITDDQGTNAGIGNSYTRAETDAVIASTCYTKDQVDNLIAPNYQFYQWTGLTSVTDTVSYTMTIQNKRGNPFFLMINGDINPIAGGAGWAGISIYKGNTRLQYQIVESKAESQNIPFSLSCLDGGLTKGTTYTYTFKLYDGGSGTINFRESGDDQSPRIIIFEL